MRDDNGKLIVPGQRGWRLPTQADLDKDAELTRIAQEERGIKRLEEAQSRANTIIVQQVVDPGASTVQQARPRKAKAEAQAATAEEPTNG